MDINNPQFRESIIAMDGEIVRPRVRTVTEAETLIPRAKTILHKDDSVDEYYFPRVIACDTNHKIEFHRKSVVTGGALTPDPGQVLLINLDTGEYYFTRVIVNDLNEKLEVQSKTLAQAAALAPKANVAVIKDLVADEYYMPRALVEQNGGLLIAKVIDIDDWDMNAGGAKTVAHGLDYTKIRHVDAVIRRDDDSIYYPVPCGKGTVGDSTVQVWIGEIGSTNVNIYRLTDGTFDHANFSASPFVRGWVTAWYVE